MRRPLVTLPVVALALAALALVTLAAPAAAQRGRSTRGPLAADSLISLAQETARLGDTTRAIKLLENATRTAPGYAPAFYQHGVMLSRATRLGLGDILQRRAAGGALERALQLDPDNPRYLIELGRLRLKTPLLRLDAERLFSRALRSAERAGGGHDLAEVNWELGQIFERRYMTTAHRRMFSGAVSGFDIGSAAGDFRYTREMLQMYTQVIPNSGELDYRKAEEHYRASLSSEPGHEGAALGLLGLLVDQERYEEMLKVARDAALRRPRSARLKLAGALALHRVDRDDEAEALFDSALVLLDSAERRDMTRLETVVRKEDAKRLGLLAGDARVAADSMFWDLADPLRLTATNEARVEFLARVTQADLRFSSSEFGQKGWKTDRGIVLVRYGPPPEIATFAPEANDARDPDAAGRVTTVWWYPETNMRFVFVGPPAMNYAFFGGDFRSYAENAREISPIRFDNVAALKVDSVAVQVARFRGETGGVDVSIFADIPTRRMLRDVDVQQALLQTALFVGDGARRIVATQGDSTIIRADARDSLTSRAWRRRLPAGEYVYRVEARQPASGKAARGMAGLSAVAYPSGTLALSDILVARRIQQRPGVPGIRSRDDILIVPNASLTFAPRDTAHLYWEAYGLERDSTGNGRLRVELALTLRRLERGNDPVVRVIGGLSDIVGLSAEGDDRVVLRYDRSIALDASDRQANYLALDLGDAPAGAYALELTVTDLVSGRRVVQRRDLTVPRR
jgi:GWxTD domain-containing protein